MQFVNTRTQSDELIGLWEELELLSSDKGTKLQEASEEQIFLRSVNDFDLWIDEVGKALASEDLGKVILQMQLRGLCGHYNA